MIVYNMYTRIILYIICIRIYDIYIIYYIYDYNSAS